MPKIKYRSKNFKDATLEIIEQADDIVTDYAAQGYDLTLRQLYYQFVSRDLLPNTQASYDRLGSIVNDARLAGLIDWKRIVDRTRNLEKLPHWKSPHEIIETCAAQFNIDLWANQKWRPEVWIEKDALVGVIEGVCEQNDVPFFSCRGYTSQSEMWRASMRMGAYLEDGNNQQPIIFHLGDHDPSGIDMSRDILDRIQDTFEVFPVEFKRLALNMDQIDEYRPPLPPNPAKLTDSRIGGYLAEYGDESWELDALEPAYIENLIQTALDEIRDADIWAADIDERDKHRENLEAVAENWDRITQDWGLE